MAAKLVDDNGQETIVPDAVMDAVREVLRIAERGAHPIVVDRDRELTTGEAARILGMSRQSVVDLCDKGELACNRTGTHRRIPAAEVRRLREDRISRHEVELDRLRSAGGPTLEAVRSIAPTIREIVERHGGTNIRVFGAVARDRPTTDLDLLVDLPPTAALFAVAALQNELRDRLPWPVDVLPGGVDPGGPMGHVLDEAIPL